MERECRIHVDENPQDGHGLAGGEEALLGPLPWRKRSLVTVQ
jgi:hypothetical protein